MKNQFLIFIFLFSLFMTGCLSKPLESEPPVRNNSMLDTQSDATGCSNNSSNCVQTPEETIKKTFTTSDLSSADSHFNFKTIIPKDWEVEYIPASQAINFYNPNSPEGNSLEQSQIFVRFFTASKFLTLSTVTIYSREELTINGRPAVRYDIEKKEGVSNFPDQPKWRSKRHSVTDIRSTDDNPATFYVFAGRPDLDQKLFEDFLNSLELNPSPESTIKNAPFISQEGKLSFPIENFSERVTKKPFGIFVTSDDSPVQPERFSGYHTGSDAEIIVGEENADVPVIAIAGGEIFLKKTASGYGGVVIIEHGINGKIYSALYGHLNISSVSKSIGEKVVAGETIGILGRGESTETDGERKHLHFSLKEGRSDDLRGYVNSEEELNDWINPINFFKK